jgi:SAM-dependent MidA family methyltransferase
MDFKKFRDGEIRIHGCFLSNELVDAFPVHRVILDQGNLKELYVTQREGQFEERWGEPSDPRISDYFQSMDIALREGQKAEVNLRALEWMENVARCLERGFVLTIDYGYLAKELYAPHRREGTLLCYSRHQISDNPYERLGEQDITSHVNFTSLIRKGEEVGLQVAGLVPQYRFLIGLGILEQMETLGSRVSELEGLKLRLSLKHLIEPEMGMGEVFKVLIQHKGMGHPQLDGLKDLNSTSWPHPPTFSPPLGDV